MLVLVLVSFVIGYLAIILEHTLRINKAATALVTGVLCWTIFILVTDNKVEIVTSLSHHMGDISQILFFLLGAMTIVELMDAYDGFSIITNQITTKNKVKLVWMISFFSFFLSAVLDNLTTAIVMVSLIRKLVNDKNDRLIFAGAVIISSNAGGAWSPIGDVTTTMLWIGEQITATNVMLKLFFPSLICMIIPVFVFQLLLKGEVTRPELPIQDMGMQNKKLRSIVFFSGIAILLMVPFFKTVTHLPPFMGILLGLGLLWIIIEIIHRSREIKVDKQFSVAFILRKIDTSSILFFLGILLSIAALESTGQLKQAAQGVEQFFAGNRNLIVLSMGLLSSVVDNVPLVAASMGMYSLEQYPTDHSFWIFLAYATGTGGSILVIGSAAGVAAMGIEKIDFVWYLKKISWIALAGYICGAVVYMLMN